MTYFSLHVAFHPSIDALALDHTAFGDQPQTNFLLRKRNSTKTFWGRDFGECNRESSHPSKDKLVHFINNLSYKKFYPTRPTKRLIRDDGGYLFSVLPTSGEINL